VEVPEATHFNPGGVHDDPDDGSRSAIQPGQRPETTWAQTEEIIATAELFWINTVRADGRPHATPLVAVWDGETLCFCTGETEQKALNLSYNPNVLLTTGTNIWDRGVDVVVEGATRPVVEADRLRQLAELWRTKWAGDWRYEVGEGCFHNPGSSGRVLVFSVAPTKVMAFAQGTFSHTTHRFELA
jgi:nitroimidazol reductase NimA-like FMN-containing flavoprotein (pyridoxamine 5'-phosphate oxidase superfamily)